MTSGSEVEVDIRSIAGGGAGVGTLPDGRVVFVHRTAPGDRVRVSVHRSKSRWAGASLVEVLAAGPTRVEPPCPLYDVCGGCQLQHLTDEAQRAAKGAMVRDALIRLGGLEGLEAPEVFASPRPIRYRSRASFTLRRLRGGRVVAGFHALDGPSRVVDVPDCLLVSEELADCWGALRGAWGGGARHLPGGGRLRLTLRLLDDGPELVVQGGAPGWSAEAVLQGVPQLRRVWQIPASDGDAWTGEPILAGGEPHPAGGTAFAQVNAEVARELVGHVVAVSGTPGVDAGADRAVDAYGGTGEFARALSARGWSVTAIESDAGAVGMARDGLDDAEVMDVLHALVEDALPGRLPAALLVVNPPRSGLSEAVRGCILDAPPTRLVYVSCDPATLARDVRALSGCFELDGLRCFDLFPQTAHVETVAVFTRSQPEFAA